MSSFWILFPTSGQETTKQPLHVQIYIHRTDSVLKFVKAIKEIELFLLGAIYSSDSKLPTGFQDVLNCKAIS